MVTFQMLRIKHSHFAKKCEELLQCSTKAPQNCLAKNITAIDYVNTV